MCKEGVTVVRKCDSPQKVCGEVLWSWGEVTWLEEVYHLTGSVTVIREV